MAHIPESSYKFVIPMGLGFQSLYKFAFIIEFDLGISGIPALVHDRWLWLVILMHTIYMVLRLK